MPASDTSVPVNRLELDDLVVTSRGDGTNIVVALDGTADQHSSERLSDFFTRIHSDVVRDGIPAVVVDIRRLEFMNSSSFKSLVTWISEIHDLEPEKRYKIRVQSNTSIQWQRRSLQSLMYFAVDLITVEYPPLS